VGQWNRELTSWSRTFNDLEERELHAKDVNAESQRMDLARLFSIFGLSQYLSQHVPRDAHHRQHFISGTLLLRIVYR
jgi:hypothetical protein